MDRKADITLQDEGWSGWVRDAVPVVHTARVTVAQGTVLSAATLHEERSGPEEVGSMSYEVTVERIDAERVGFLYRRLVISNPDGTINLTAPSTGRFVLGFGESTQLVTPTMDAGIHVSITLHEIV